MQSSHTDFGQAGYPQQYTYQQLSGVPSNSSHDMSKQVAAGQPGIFPNSGGMASAVQQHHQSVMGGPVATHQSNSQMQQGQQINRGTLNTIQQSYFQRPAVPRAMPNIGRNPLTPVVNQTGQQSPYSMVQMVPSTQFHPQLVMNQYSPVYQHRGYAQQQHFINPTPPQLYATNNWNFSNQPQQTTNNYYTQHGMQPFNTMTPQMAPQKVNAPQAQQRKNVLSIVNPDTGKSIFESSGDESNPHSAIEKESETAELEIRVQFATQVAAEAFTNSQNEPSSKSSVDDPRIVDSQNIVLCPTEIEAVRIEAVTSEICDAESLGELTNTENLGDIEYIESCSSSCNEESAVPFFKKDVDPININERVMYGNEKCASKNIDSMAVTVLRDPKVYMLSEDHILKESDDILQTDVQINETCTLPENPPIYCEVPTEINSVQSAEFNSSIISHDIVQPANIPSNLIIEDTKIPEGPVDEPETNASATNSKLSDKSIADGKKNKAKKKKDYNKRETKEGSEMDAFLVKGEEVAVPSPPVPSVPESIDRLPSPVPIVDSDILSDIPLPGETFSFPPNDISPSEPTSETSSVSPTVESEEKEICAEDSSNKITLKYNYREDQWSPVNIEGKKQYDREFLLQLQSQPMSMTKPSNLPNLDVIKDKAHIQRLTEVSRIIPQMIPPMRTFDPFMPNYARGGPPRMPHPPVNRRSQTGRGEKSRKVIVFNSLSQTVKLHESENAWKPAHKAEPTTEKSSDEAAEKERLRRSVQGVLNKLTPQKFDTLLNQLKNLNIDTVEKLNVVIDLIFEKAVDEPNFSVPYANLCKQLALIRVPVVGGQPDQMVNFRKLLLTKCQKEFEQDRCDEIKHEERMKAIEEAEPEKQKELKLVYEDEEKKMRYRQLGNIRFIGELFKLGMLIEPIMHECIKKLLSQEDEESLECLCKLLKTIGKELDEGKAASAKGQNNMMDVYFGQMQKYVDKRLTSSRVRFMLQDVIDLKKCNWVPRRDENNPKTIDQIHKEAEREAREQQQVYQNMSNYTKRMPDDRDRRKSAGRNVGQSEDGWTPTSKCSKTSYTVVDPTKLKLTKPDEVDSMRLGPGGRGMQSWGRGSSGGTKNAEAEVKTAFTNRYSALAEQPQTTGYEGRRGSQRSAASSRESSRGRSNQLPPAIRKTPSASKERESLLETVKGLARAVDSKAQDVKKGAVHLNGKAIDSDELCLKGPEYSEDDIERKTKPLIEEFLHNNDFEEAIKCVTELASPNTVDMFISAAINNILERSSPARNSLGTLLYTIVKKKVITLEHYKKGFGRFLENLDDYEVDIPLIRVYIGEIIEPIIEDCEFPIMLSGVLQPCMPSVSAGLVVSAVLHSAAKRKGNIMLGEVWRESGLQWTEFLGCDVNINEFIQKNKLEFTLNPQKVKPNTQMSLEEIKENLARLLKEIEPNEDIFDWIDANVSESTDPQFIRALVPAVLQSSLSESSDGLEGSSSRLDLDAGKLKTRSPLLTRYIGHKDNLELQALFSVQSLMHELGHPNGLLRQIFDVLYDDDVITDVTFRQWQKNDDSEEMEGKAIAVHSASSFFTWLSESDDLPASADEADE